MGLSPWKIRFKRKENLNCALVGKASEKLSAKWLTDNLRLLFKIMQNLLHFSAPTLSQS